MSILHVGENGRTYERRFDHEEAARLYASGEFTQAQLAERYGVSHSAINQALKRRDEEWRKRKCAYGRAYMREHYRVPCKGGCGRLVWTLGARSGLCRTCMAASKATSVRPDTLRCSRCRAWKPDADFPWSTRRKARRGRHDLCRGCQAADRQERRLRNTVPCKECGRPRLNAKDSGSAARGLNDTGLCLSCYRRSIRKDPHPQTGKEQTHARNGQPTDSRRGDRRSQPDGPERSDPRGLELGRDGLVPSKLCEASPPQEADDGSALAAEAGPLASQSAEGGPWA